MANITATFTNRAQVDKLVEALQGRGISSDRIHLSDEGDGSVRLSVEASDEAAGIVRGMLDDYQREAAGPSAPAAEGARIEDSGLTAAAAAAGAAGATGAAAAGITSFGGAAGGPLAGAVLGADVAHERVADETDAD